MCQNGLAPRGLCSNSPESHGEGRGAHHHCAPFPPPPARSQVAPVLRPCSTPGSLVWCIGGRRWWFCFFFLCGNWGVRGERAESYKWHTNDLFCLHTLGGIGVKAADIDCLRDLLTSIYPQSYSFKYSSSHTVAQVSACLKGKACTACTLVQQAASGAQL